MKLTYPLKHWLTTLIISPIFLGIYDSLVDTEFVFNEPSIYMLFLTMGAVLSLPGLFIYFLTHKRLLNTNLTDLEIRFTLMLIATIMSVVAFSLIKGSLMIPMMLSYITGVLISGWVYPVRES